LSRRDIEHYARLFANLNTSKNRRYWTDATKYQAPYKPFLLLSVIDLFEQGEIGANFIELSHDLVNVFSSYCEKVWVFDGDSKIQQPFYYLRSEGFWHLPPNIRSHLQLRSLAVGVRLDEELYEFLQIQEARHRLRRILIETYFSPEVQEPLIQQGIINREAFLYSEELLKRPDDQALKETLLEEEKYRPAVRDQGFRRAVVTAYAHRCALCGIRVRTLDGHTVVEAAHIRTWSETYDDRPANGLSLCRTCHWTFDKGLLRVSAAYEIHASTQLRIDSNLPGYLISLEGRSIVLPSKGAYWPDADCLKWHHEYVFRRG
jgi:putative restriction endonuclease